MVAAQIVARPGFAPGDAQRRDQRTVISLVLMRQDHAMADVVETTAITCRLFLLRQQMISSVLPLLDETSAVIGE